MVVVGHILGESTHCAALFAKLCNFLSMLLHFIFPNNDFFFAFAGFFPPIVCPFLQFLCFIFCCYIFLVSVACHGGLISIISTLFAVLSQFLQFSAMFPQFQAFSAFPRNFRNFLAISQGPPMSPPGLLPACRQHGSIMPTPWSCFFFFF